MIDQESDIRPIGYGAMLVECLVGVMASSPRPLCTRGLLRGQYPPATFATLTFHG
jgi:carbon starvation protein CstA